MKRLLIIGLLAVYTHISTAQNAEELVSPKLDTMPAAKPVSIEERLNRQQHEIENLKKDNQALKRQLNAIKFPLPNAKRRVVVLRVGSKQVLIE